MAERKNVTINFYKLESAVDTFYLDLDHKLTELAKLENPFGFFDGKSSELMFRVDEPIKLGDRTLHLVSIVKEKVFLPVRFNREGEIQEAVESPDSLGDVSYGLIDTENGCILVLGGRASNFSDFARWLTGDSAAEVGVQRIEDAQAAEIERLKVKVAELETDLDSALEERDNREEALTNLSVTVGTYFGVDVGEWSNLNSPYEKALEILDGEYITAQDKENEQLKADNARMRGALETIFDRERHERCYQAEDVKYVFAYHYHEFRQIAEKALKGGE